MFVGPSAYLRHAGREKRWKGDPAYGVDRDARSGADANDWVPLSNPSDLNEHRCIMSPGVQRYQPCANAGD
jgi:hypothetical protein